MDRRDTQRRARRVQVQFAKRGDSQTWSGYSTNFSPSGMFVSTTTPLRRGERLRLEVLDAQCGFAIEGLVMHSTREEYSLGDRPAGMGVRFLRVEDLITELLRSGAQAASAAGAVASVEMRGNDGAFPVRFSSASDFLTVVKRDIHNGGIFVNTETPAALGTNVTIDIHPPYEHAVAVRLVAQVVQRFDPKAPGSAAGPRLAGMGVVFTDPQGAILRLQPAIDRLAE